MRGGVDAAGIYVNDGGVAGYGSGPFHVKISLHLITLAGAGVRADEHDLRLIRSEVKAGAEGAYIGEADVRLPYHHQLLPGAVKSRSIKRSDVVDNGQVIGREVVRGTAVKGRDQLVQRARAEIVQAAHGAYDLFKG